MSSRPQSSSAREAASHLSPHASGHRVRDASTSEKTLKRSSLPKTADLPAMKTPRSTDGVDNDKGTPQSSTKSDFPADMNGFPQRSRARLRSPWSCSPLTFATAVTAILTAVLIIRSFLTRQLDPKGCAMSLMRPSFYSFSDDFNTEHTRFATKYSLHLYRERGIDEESRVVKGIPVLFIPGNAGSYKQVRPFAAEAAVHFDDVLRNSQDAPRHGKQPLDFFSVDFNEDITAFHGQTLLDQAEYLNDAVAYILSLYHKPNQSIRDTNLPDPTSVILIGHSMGGIVARTMLTLPNYQINSINTIVTLAAPHARAPISFDSDIVRTYDRVNSYWRDSFSMERSNENPLSHVAVISFAGGGLDNMVPSDYSTLASLVPPTHGFTVFTSTVPQVWTGMDHLAITWCDQLRKSVVRALYDVVDARRPNQTRPLPERMRSFKRWLLTGLEDVAENSLTRKEPNTLLTLDDDSSSILSQGERLVLRNLGKEDRATAHLLPIPPQGSPEQKRFTFLSNRRLDAAAPDPDLEVLFCSVSPAHVGQSVDTFPVNMNFSTRGSGSTGLGCKSSASDAILLPASLESSAFPFDQAPPFSYLQYDIEHLADHQFVAVVDKSTHANPGWAIAEFSSKSESIIHTKQGLRSLILSGMDIVLPTDRPMVSEVKIPSIHSSLLSYKLDISRKSCGKAPELFKPLLRQHISEPYESKFFVNVQSADISMHGVAPYMPPSLKAGATAQGLTLQFWSDPTCNQEMDIALRVDFVGSLGKLWMRYRTIFAAFPLLVVALVLRKQFQFYDKTGIFMSFSESMDQSLRRSIPVLLLALTFLTMSFSKASQQPHARSPFGLRSGDLKHGVDFSVNELLLGSQDPFFWFLVPLFGLISVGVCIAVNYAFLSMTHVLSIVYTRVLRLLGKGSDQKILNTFTESSPRRRILVTSLLLFLVSTVIPYQFVFITLCLVQIHTCIRALSLTRETRASENINFYNYVHSIFLLMLWVLPINMPVLVVWIHNLAVHWLTPFSSHHNILSILPFLVLVETQSTGRMVARVTNRMRHLTSILFFSLAFYAAIYGATFAYLLHYIANIVCAWLTALHLYGTISTQGFKQALWFRGSSGEWLWAGSGNGGSGSGSAAGREKRVKKRP